MFKRTTEEVLLVAILVSVVAFAVHALSNREPSGEFILEGRSTLHGYKCRSTDIQAYADNGTGMRIVIPVKSLECGNGKLEKNLFKTLKAEEHPEITYTIPGYASDTLGAEQTAVANVSFAGDEKNVTLRIARYSNGSTTVVSGEHRILMTDFGIKPPRIMRGAIRVANEVHIRFNIRLQ